MAKYKDILKDLLKYLARSRVSLAGSVVSSLIFPVLLISVILDMQGVVDNPYFGFLIYLVMGPLFVAGLLTVAFGLFFFKDSEEIGLFTLEYISEQLRMPGRFIRVRKMIYISVAIFAFTILVIVTVSYTGFKYSETIGFCGQFCHDVMEPEYITHLNSSHSRISCVQCHISGSSDLATRTKVSGVKMIFSTMLEKYDRPIKNPIYSLRPDREVCEQCHRPEVFHGDKLYVKESFLPDKDNTSVKTVLLMRVGAGGYREHQAGGIHWHVSPDHNVYYQTGPGGNDDIVSVKLKDHDGSTVIFDRNGADKNGGSEYVLMDCMDCHNRPTHVFLSPDEAIDRKITVGSIPRQLPFIKKVTLEVIQHKYAHKEQARRGIAVGIETWYRENAPGVMSAQRDALDKAINGAFQAWSENVFPKMNINWNTYRNNVQHGDGRGCFRCHSDSYRSREGAGIPSNCDLCHYILADREPLSDIMHLLGGVEQ